MTRKQLSLLIVGGSMLLTNISQAAYIESGDASNHLSSAQTATDAVIQGTISQDDEGDVFKLNFSTGGTLDISAISLSIDTNIGLFDAGFNALIGNDDVSDTNLNSFLSYVISAGTYYLGIGDYAMYAENTSNEFWFMDGLAPNGFGAVDHIDNKSFIDTGEYEIHLSIQPDSVTVPEPAIVALLGLGFAGMRFARRKTV